VRLHVGGNEAGPMDLAHPGSVVSFYLDMELIRRKY